jgi:hypothetical protein
VPQGLERYSLTSNPYWALELDATKRPEDASLLTAVDGFRRIAELDDRIAIAVEQKQPCFFLFVGRTGAGRSSVANHLLARYREARGVEPDRFAVGVADELDHSTLSLLENLMIDLVTELDGKTLDIDEKLKDAALSALPQNTEPGKAAALLKLHARRLSVAVSNLVPPSAFGIRVEDAPDFAAIKHVLDVFAKAETMVVFTVQDYKRGQQEVLLPFREHVGVDVAREAIVPLSDIAGADVSTLVLHRWKAALEDPECDPPFDHDAIEHALGDPPRSVARVMRVMGKVLDAHAQEIGAGDPWPQDKSLAFTRDLLRQKVQASDD